MPIFRSNARPRTRAKRSIVRKFSKHSDDKKSAFCTVKKCNEKVITSGNTTNIKDHLKRRHELHLREAEGKNYVHSSSSGDDEDISAENTTYDLQYMHENFLSFLQTNI